MSMVRILPAAEADRIAAGEVVERPASVVRELVENALDAGATRLDVALQDGGLESIRVADDGHGMAAEDAAMALHRHATSKITCLEDLERVTTLGFRGEALPSIASVSRLTLETAAGGDGAGTRLVVEGGQLLSTEPCPRARGTTVSVENLFFNTPARRKFLKKSAAEFTRVSDLLLPELLSRHQVACRLAHGDRVSFDLAPASNLRERVSGFWGSRFARDLLPVDAEAAGMHAHGLVTGPDTSRGSRRNWYFFVNGRPVRDPLLVHAAGEGVAGALPKGRYPVLYLFLDLPGDAVDVNVHPAKSEVRFAERGAVFALVRAAVRKAMKPDTYLAHGTGVVPEVPAGGGTTAWETAAPARPEASAGSSAMLTLQPDDAAQAALLTANPDPVTPAPAVPGTEEGAAGTGTASPVILAQYRDCFILAHDGQALYMLDQHAAHERVLYEEICERFARRESSRQSLLFPRPLQWEPGKAGSLEAIVPALDRLGFTVEPFGEDALMVRQVPVRLPEARALEALEDIVPLLVEAEGTGEEESARLRLQHKVAATLACHAAVRFHDRLNQEKMEEIVRRWQQCADPLTCPHGRTAVVRWPHGRILKAFGRE